MDKPQPLHIPDSNGVFYKVLVFPHKRYGDVLGSELIERYGKKLRSKPIKKPSPLSIENNKLFLPCGKLPEYTLINGSKYQTQKILNKIEEKTHTKIYSKRENRIVKNYQNTTVQIPSIFE